MTLSYPPPNSRWRGDGLSGFREILVLPYWDEEFIFFAPTSEGWKEFFLTYSLEPETLSERVATLALFAPPVEIPGYVPGQFAAQLKQASAKGCRAERQAAEKPKLTSQRARR